MPTRRSCSPTGAPAASSPGARTIPFHWYGTLETLPAGIDALGLQAISEPHRPTALSALAAEVAAGYQGSGLSRLAVAAMAAVARRHDLAPLVAPVRPSWKDRYPLTPIERCARWRREDGLPFDPWLRVHARPRSPDPSPGAPVAGDHRLHIGLGDVDCKTAHSSA